MNLLKKHLHNISTRIFEDLCYVVQMDELPGGEVSRWQFQAAASVDFNGPSSGELTVKLYGKLLSEVASNMMGVDESDVSMEVQLDSLGEIANVICSNLIPEVFGQKSEVRVGTPKTITSNLQGGPAEGTNAEKVSMSFENGVAEIYFWCRERGASACGGSVD